MMVNRWVWEEVFGKEPIAPSEMTKKIWAFVKENNLGKK